MQWDRISYYATLLFPLGFLPLFSPITLFFAAPSLLLNTLSNNGLMRQIDYQYTTDITPFLFVSAIMGFAYLRSRLKSTRLDTHVVLAFIACITISSYLWGEIPLTRLDRFYYFIWEIPEKKIMKQVAESVESRYTVSVTNNIGAHFAKRQYLYNFPVNALKTDYSIALLGDQFAWPSGGEQQKTVNELLKSSDYELIVNVGDFYAFKRVTIP